MRSERRLADEREMEKRHRRRGAVSHLQLRTTPENQIAIRQFFHDKGRQGIEFKYIRRRFHILVQDILKERHGTNSNMASYVKTRHRSLRTASIARSTEEEERLANEEKCRKTTEEEEQFSLLTAENNANQIAIRWASYDKGRQELD
ncbi:hypothetical protein AVEN_84910-1 [Araneus ventricosus]|uniref:Uncharacterized protein n=1 Tax=Araneus ventricosus TaxID=182803 RepID=A0A4Y2RAC3_ARAVE|nr:hypothetical protein AVEN_84910-1 [Araneus ventricosus]